MAGEEWCRAAASSGAPAAGRQQRGAAQLAGWLVHTRRLRAARQSSVPHAASRWMVTACHSLIFLAPPPPFPPPPCCRLHHRELIACAAENCLLALHPAPPLACLKAFWETISAIQDDCHLSPLQGCCVTHKPGTSYSATQPVAAAREGEIETGRCAVPERIQRSAGQLVCGARSGPDGGGGASIHTRHFCAAFMCQQQGTPINPDTAAVTRRPASWLSRLEGEDDAVLHTPLLVLRHALGNPHHVAHLLLPAAQTRHGTNAGKRGRVEGTEG